VARLPKDKDYVETKEGLLFTIVGYLHPPDAYTAYLKYRPNSTGKWEREGVHYQRMMQVYSASEVESSSNWLLENHPDYIKLDPVRGIKLPLVPWENIVAYYLPEVRLAEIMRDPQDPLESKAKALVTLLSERSGVEEGRFGISGSILLELHNPLFSDIDLLVYGQENVQRVRNVMDELFGEDLVKPYSGEEILAWQLRQVRTLGIPARYAEQITWSHWQRGRFSQSAFSISPVRMDGEIMNQYGAETFSPVESVEFTATIMEDQDNLFVPARYLVGDIHMEEGDTELPALTEILSFEGVFASVFHRGDQVRIRGIVEAIRDMAGNIIRNHVVVGTLSTQGWIIRIPSS
jgi:predicted nucleotidyltransferase